MQHILMLIPKLKARGASFPPLRFSSKLLIVADLLPLIYFFLTARVIVLKCLVTL